MESLDPVEEWKRYRPPLDPLETAKQQGNVLGMGAAGRYKKTVLTRIGYVLIGSAFLIPGLISVVGIAYSMFQDLGRGIPDDMPVAVALFMMIVGTVGSVAIALLGLSIVRHAFGKKRPTKPENRISSVKSSLKNFLTG